MLVFGKYAFQTLFFQNIPTNPMISKFNFYDILTLELYSALFSDRDTTF